MEKAGQADNLLNFDILYNAYQATVKPFMSLATIQSLNKIGSIGITKTNLFRPQ